MSEASAIPNYAQVIIVPVANPVTASGLIQLAQALAHPETGRIIALIVSLGDPEKEARAIAEIEPVFQELLEKSDSPQKLELVTHTSTSITRGILDVAREEAGDLIILGLAEPRRGEVAVGTIAEGVAQAAPCDVLIYRQGAEAAVERIIIPADGSEDARIACSVGLILGNTYGARVEAMYVQSSDADYWNSQNRIEASLQGLAGAKKVKRTVITATDVVKGLLARISDTDLLVVGFAREGVPDHWLYDELSRGLLNMARGPVILTAQSNNTPDDLNRMKRFLRWAHPVLTYVEQDDLVRQARDAARLSLDFIVLMLVASILATLGLLTNSGAVIIGAMLVAPLMSPLIAFSTGMTTGRSEILRQASITVLQAVALALGVSFFIGFLSPVDVITAEMAARGNPRLPDMGVALASGLIGAYATARRDIPAALAGVAIAAALVPPICTVGLGLAYQDAALWRGAALLFVTNILSIVLAAWAVFFWMGMRPRRVTTTSPAQAADSQEQEVETSRVRQYTSLVLVASLLIAVGFLLVQNVDPNTYEVGINRALNSAFVNSDVLSFDIRRDEPLLVIATVRASPELLASGRFEEEVQAARQALIDDLNDETVELRVVVQPEVRVRTPAEERIRHTLEAGFSGEVTNMLILDGIDTPITSLPLTDPAITQVTINATVRADEATVVTEAEVVRQALSALLGVPVELNIEISTGVRIGD